MVRLHIIVEGQTEEAFVKRMLVDDLARYDVFVDVRRVETGRRRATIFRGGMTTYRKAKRDFERWMKQDVHSEVHFTSMFDLYALPSDFPGVEEGKKKNDPYAKVEYIEKAFAEDLGHPRFIPYIQLHEFEALLFSDPKAFGVVFVEQEHAVRDLVTMRQGFDSPEVINDGQDTAPSKRIISKIPSYEDQKPSAGPLIASAIGLPALERECRHFSLWLRTLRRLAV